MRRFTALVAALACAALVSVALAPEERPRVLREARAADEGLIRVVASIFSASAPGGAGILLTHAGAVHTPRWDRSALRVTVQLQTSGTLKLRVSNGATTKDLLLFEGGNLTAGRPYSFVIDAPRSQISSVGAMTALTYDFLLGTDGGIDQFVVTEVFGAMMLPSPAQGPGGGAVTATLSGDATVVGKAADGATVAGFPVLMGGFDGTLTQTILTDTSGRVRVIGGAAAGAAAAGDPLGIAGVDSASSTTRPLLLADGSIVISPELPWRNVPSRVKRVSSTSDGTNGVTLVAGAAGEVVYCAGLLAIYNSHATTTHTLTLYSGSTAGTVLLGPIGLAAGATAFVDPNPALRTDTGQGLVLALAASGADVRVSGAVVRQ